MCVCVAGAWWSTTPRASPNSPSSSCGRISASWCTVGDPQNAHTRTHLELAAALRSLSTCSPAPPSGPAAVLPAGPAHPHLPVGVPLHQQRSALLAGAEVVPVQPSLGRQRDGQAGKVSVVSASRPPGVSIWNKRRSISRPAVLIFTHFMPPSINRNRRCRTSTGVSHGPGTVCSRSFFFFLHRKRLIA